MSMGVLTTDTMGIITTMNKRASEMTGKSSGESLADIVGDSVIQKIMSGKEGISLDIEVKGKVFSFDLSPLPLKPSWQVLACIRDVTVGTVQGKRAGTGQGPVQGHGGEGH
ncbi:MAG: cell wall metabolism sensor histidine kinase WalK [Anaerotruncus sp.]|nr:cell wall metabolism sensor histidine kinase WalK [Anaerotruncus sp.]